jgi:hypothetical protein
VGGRAPDVRAGIIWYVCWEEEEEEHRRAYAYNYIDTKGVLVHAINILFWAVFNICADAAAETVLVCGLRVYFVKL